VNGRWLVGILGIVTSGCASVPATVQQHYTLTASESQATRFPVNIHYDTALQIAAVDAPSWLNSRDIYYRLLYQDQDSIAAYSQAQWITAPPIIIGRLLTDHLADTNLWKAVVNADSNAVTNLTLHVNLLEFQQEFTSAKQSQAVLRARATLVDNRSNEVIAQSDFVFQVPAAHADAEGGVAALDKATTDMLNAITQWLMQVMGKTEKVSALEVMP